MGIMIKFSDNGYVGKQPGAWKKCCADYCLRRTPGKNG